jgi:hypothetical protein
MRRMTRMSSNTSSPRLHARPSLYIKEPLNPTIALPLTPAGTHTNRSCLFGQGLQISPKVPQHLHIPIILEVDRTLRKRERVPAVVGQKVASLLSQTLHRIPRPRKRAVFSANDFSSMAATIDLR